MLMDLVDYAPRALPSGRAFADPPYIFDFAIVGWNKRSGSTECL
jgi:hypothetical protein